MQPASTFAFERVAERLHFRLVEVSRCNPHGRARDQAPCPTMKALKAAVQKHARILTWCGWISSAVLLLLSFDAFFSGVVLLRLRPAPARGFLLRRNPSARNWLEIEKTKAQLPRYDLSSEAFLAMPVWVVSLQRSSDRRAAVAQNLEAQSLDFDFVDAVDGQEEVDWIQVLLTQRSNRRQGFVAHDHYTMGKVGSDLSHLKVMHRMLGAGEQLALILEDDASLTPDFNNTLYQKLLALPEDWDVLFLNGCFVQTGEYAIYDGLFVDRESLCMMGYVARSSYAMRVLQAVLSWKLHTNIDNLLRELIRWGEIQAYITSPYLIEPAEQNFPSTNEVWRHEG